MAPSKSSPRGTGRCSPQPVRKRIGLEDNAPLGWVSVRKCHQKREERGWVSPGIRRPDAPASVCRMSDLGGELDALASRTTFSGVVRIDQSDRIELARAYGLAHRGFEIPNAVDTRFGIASGAKGFTALAVVSLIEEGVLELSTPARSVLGSDLPVIDDGVTVEHLLSHRSG